ncbi:MAG TPA: pirin family protein [Terriglobales bacterium]|nr:pirin family protein [Terriglobales bacterium]
MIKVRKAEERGHADHGWLNTFHTFSFADYYDPANMGFRSLRVINEDWVQPGRGFGTHPHHDMEIITYIMEGALEHKDSMGTGSVIRPGEVQRMSAGTGVTHSEFNPSRTEPVHLMQIWLLPERSGIKPSYEQRDFPRDERRGKLQLVASGDAEDGALMIHQDAKLFATELAQGERVKHDLAPGRYAWLQVARGNVKLNGQELKAGDGAAVTSEPELVISANGDGKPSELLLFDLA